MSKNVCRSVLDHPARLLSINEVAALCGVCRKTIERYHDAGRFPSPIRLAGLSLLKWKQADVVAWINDQCDAR